MVVYITDQLDAIAYDVHSLGSGSVTLLSPEDLFGRGYALRARHFIVIHNHPSGKIEPSPDDQTVMHELIEQSRIMKIALLDFIIVGALGEDVAQSRYWSMFEDMDGGEYTLGSAA